MTYKSNTNDRHLKQRSLQYDHKNGGMILKKFVYKIKYTKIVFHFYSYRQLIGLSAFNHFIYVQPLNQTYNNFRFM